MRGRWRTGRLAGLVAALVLGGGLGGLAGTGAASAAAACAPWSGTQPVDPAEGVDGNILNGVAVVDRCDVWVVGQVGGVGPTEGGLGVQALIEQWTGGRTWTDWTAGHMVVPGAEGSDLLAVAAVARNQIWTVGHYSDGTGQHGLLASFDGAQWTPAALSSSIADLTAMTAISATDVWASGTDTAGGLVLLHYDGTGWTQKPAPAITTGADGDGGPPAFTLTGMTATSASDVWAVGYFTVGSSNRDIPLSLHWNGTAWSQVAVPELTPPDDLGTQLASVSAASPSDAWAVGSSDFLTGTVILHWDGHSWTPVQSPDPGAGPPGPGFNALSGVTVVSANSAWAVGSYGTSGSNTADHSLVLHWDGSSWTQLSTRDPGDERNALQAIAPGPAGLVFAAGFFDMSGSGIQPLAAVFGVVPSVVGQQQAAAVDAMASAGLDTTIAEATTVRPGCHLGLKGTVISTSPAAGAVTHPPVTVTVCDVPPQG